MGSGKPSEVMQGEWRDRLERWRQSKLTDDEFAAIEGVKPSALKWWGWRLKGKGGGRAGLESKAAASTSRRRGPTKPTFVEVMTAQPAMAGAACHYEVVLGNGRVVRVPRGFHEAELVTLLAILDGGPR